MARKRYKSEEIAGLLRQAEVLHGQGKSMVDAIRQLGISEVTFYRWRKEHGGMSGDQLRRAVSGLTLDKQILAEAARGYLISIRGLRVNAPLRTPSARTAVSAMRGAILSPTHLPLTQQGNAPCPSIAANRTSTRHEPTSTPKSSNPPDRA